MSGIAARTDPDLARVWHWLTFQRELLEDAQIHVTPVARTSQLGWAPSRPYERRFTGLTSSEVHAFFKAQLAELEILVTLEILASTEAALRLDLRRRVSTKRKDPISRRFRAFNDPDRARLDEDILEVWAAEASIKVGEFRGLLKLRNWLAHGRHWLLRLGRDYKVEDAYRISAALLNAIETASNGF
ncbi:MAG TPA: hypothetical protein VGL53_26220 [Bryobacteraceae bacterium]